MVHIAVVGAGAVGLSSALNILKLIPSSKVTIIADKFGHETTSSGAGGLFRPVLDHFPGVNQDVIVQWVTDSWHFFNNLATSADAQPSGQSLVTGTVFYNRSQDSAYSLLAKLAYDFHQVSPEDLTKMNVKYKYGYTFTTVITQTHKYIDWLLKRFQASGGLTQRRRLTSLTELYGTYDLVINCSGLGAQQLVGDRSMYAVKGHLVSIRAPWVKHFYLTEDDIYLIPHDDKLHIGGVRQKNNCDLTPDPAVRNKILRRAEELFPQIKGAEVVGEWTGLRPGRDVIRLEAEQVLCERGQLPVVHNYGHGGHGITLSWGAGKAAAKLALSLITASRAKL